MAVVKGSKIRPVRVVSHRPYLRFFITVGLCLIVAAAVRASFFYGHTAGMAGQEEAIARAKTLDAELADSKAKLAELEQAFENASLGAQIDRQANENVRQEVIDLKEKISALEEENSFYRGLMAPAKNKSGLTFGAVEISETDRSRVYSYKVVMQQLATNHQLINGTLSYKVEGRLNGEAVSYSLKDLSRDVDRDLVKLRFKYFQNIEGELQLPEGFEPEGIALLAKSIGKDAVTVEKRFGWLVEEI
ncbi:hypothetical protein TDB9533_00123 [Thalassocella blandensis]|nr:hypothetical protein TDB9533_00123 [Thalassocella blandensis]